MANNGVVRPGHLQLRVMEMQPALDHYIDTIGLIETDRDDQGRVYLKAWEEAVDIFSPNQVTTYIIVGLGEDDESVLSGVNMLSSLGVYPYVVPFRPIPGTSLEDLRPPSSQRMLHLYQRTTPLLKKTNLSSSKIKAGCGRCPACSALPDFETC